MRNRTLAGVLVLLSLLPHGEASAAQAAPGNDATLFRVFLKDGASLVSYGEIAHVGDRVVFSMPTGAGSPPPLHLTTLSAELVDWPRTERYALSARSGRYLETQAEADYADLSNRIAETLNQVGQTNDSARRIELVERARSTLVAWPAEHFNYRDADIRQLVTMLDAAIADLRSGSSQSKGQFAFNLVAFSTPPPALEPLLPRPTLKESIEQVLLAARLTESSADRIELYRSALGELRAAKSIAGDAGFNEWVETTVGTVVKAVAVEGRVDRNYESLSQRMLRLADLRAREGNVRAIEQLVPRVHAEDDQLGNARPDVIGSLLSAIEAKLDAARRLQLARERWALREPALAQYRSSMRGPLEQFAALKSALEDIKSLAGTSPATLKSIEAAVGRLMTTATAIEPPGELSQAHALFISAISLAQNAASIRREAALSENMQRAWDASSAAAGALMLGAKAITDIQAPLRQPQLK